MSTVLVLAETTPTGVRKATLELLTAAATLGTPVALVCGDAAPEVFATLGHYGATTVYAVSAPEFDEFLSLPKAEALVALSRQLSPTAILVTSSPEGKDIAARVAVRLDAGIITDAVSLGRDGDAVTATMLLQEQVHRQGWAVGASVDVMRTVESAVHIGRKARLQLPGRSAGVDAVELTSLAV